MKQGTRVVFDEEGSYIENKKTSKRTQIRKKSGVYVLKVKVPKSKKIDAIEEDEERSNRPGVGSDSVFVRLVNLI